MTGKPSDNERLKDQSDYLHGTISRDLTDGITGSFKGDNAAACPAASSPRSSGLALTNLRASTPSTAPSASPTARPSSITAS